jgi:hypothetical protein
MPSGVCCGGGLLNFLTAGFVGTFKITLEIQKISSILIPFPLQFLECVLIVLLSLNAFLHCCLWTAGNLGLLISHPFFVVFASSLQFAFW